MKERSWSSPEEEDEEEEDEQTDASPEKEEEEGRHTISTFVLLGPVVLVWVPLDALLFPPLLLAS
jgi:hypothetical protein